MANPDQRLVLSSERIDIWLLEVDDVHDTSSLDSYRALLAPQELALMGRFKLVQAGHRYLLARALVRVVLSRYAPIRPQDWRFEHNRYGRPLIVNTHDIARRISFNVSHTDGVIMLGVVGDRALGVDVEYMKCPAPIEIAEHCFSSKEITALHRLSPAQQPRRSFELWTLKESYIKARGMGLSIAPDQFSFEWDAAQGVTLDVGIDVDATGLRWVFWRLQPSPGHFAAVCTAVAADTDTVPTLCARRMVGLAHECLRY
ncbi:4'-phosphopantetheinyl transferase superfamily protein [Burkholderia sp. L27(2015)]|uniref:4'-phosphopantetheinyl transferase family protein n=1 Tax=Burkholderia sp. L27(2015) TaxID=1641858 RepID=UPI00131BAA75|nr:4'-phosphopantetheinyl transferase superfamily protein [Burkholderia sp. L27(2015)]